ncbi:hypothetical protein NKG94_23105 [Micromonospora sp. M12]
MLYLVFTEGHTSTAGRTCAGSTSRRKRSGSPARCTAAARRQRVGRAAGADAAHRGTRSGTDRPSGELISLADQDRSRWNAVAIAEGVALVSRALPRGPIGPYQVQAAIAALHDEAPSTQQTDWPQILALYGCWRNWSGARWWSSTGPWRRPWCTDRPPDWPPSTH